MNLLPETTQKEFNLLTIGQRGVGKTVFLAGSYAELHSDRQAESPPQLWFDCQDAQVQENIEQLLSYITQTGHYPPPTLKITNFNFSLKRHSLWGTQTLCHFSWCDIPGELCNEHNQDFRKMVFTSHGCCVFIDAYALVHNNCCYLQTLEDIIKQVMALASLVSINRLKYAFALLLTKCDLLEPDPLIWQQLKERLQPLTICLDAEKANYQTFYLHIPIVHTESASILRAKGAAAPLLWLVWELNKAHNPGLMNHLLVLVSPLLPTNFQSQPVLADGPLQCLHRPPEKVVKVKNSLNLYLLPDIRRNLLLLALAIVTLVDVIGLPLVNYKRFLQRKPNLNALENIATLERRGNFYQAIPLMEKLVHQEPKRLDLCLQLAQLYKSTGQLTKAETAYDYVLTQQKNNLDALVGKAILRDVQGDIKTAQALFAQAEKAAPTALKAQMRTVAQKTLRENDIQTQSIRFRKR